MGDESPLLEIHRALGRIEGKQDIITSTVTGLREDHDKLSKRVNGIETKLTWYTGAGAAVMFGVTFFKDKVLSLFS